MERFMTAEEAPRRRGRYLRYLRAHLRAGHEDPVESEAIERGVEYHAGTLGVDDDQRLSRLVSVSERKDRPDLADDERHLVLTADDMSERRSPWP